MKLKQLSISRKEWGDDAGKFSGSATFDHKGNEVKLHLNDHHIEQIFLVCAGSIEETAKAAARFLHVEIKNQREAIAARSAIAEKTEAA